MKVIQIDTNQWTEGLAKLEGSYRMFGPAETEGKYPEFKELEKGDVPNLNVSNTHLSAKSVVYPQSEVMFEYTLDEAKEDHHQLREIEKDYSPRAVFGIRPCDAAANLIIQRNFDSKEYRDPYWVDAFESCVFIGHACENPGATCFCTSVGFGPFNEDGLDLLLVESDNGGFLAKVITDKGAVLAKSAGWETETDAAALEPLKEAAEAKIRSKVNTDQLAKQDAKDLFDAPIWEDIGFACLNCGTCTYSCPTCWCFDIQDEVKDKSGIRMRNWDSCMYPLFTLEGSGHNPRPEKHHRIRQRFMHKLKYYVDKYQAGVQCVGCGRCVRLCPVNIDIRTVCEKMNSYKPA